jgi:hypothetical protein
MYFDSFIVNEFLDFGCFGPILLSKSSQKKKKKINLITKICVLDLFCTFIHFGDIVCVVINCKLILLCWVENTFLPLVL